MEYIEILFENVPPKFLKEIINGHLKFNASDVISSHFYIPGREQIYCYGDINEWDIFFLEKGNGDIFIAKVDIGIKLENVVVLISPTMSNIDITINFTENQLCTVGTKAAEENLKKLFFNLVEISKTFNIDNIVIGYEPAEDFDMKILEISSSQHIVFYPNEFCSPTIQHLCQLWKSVL